VVSDHTEVWLDFTVGEKGRATSETTVEFTIPAGGASAVVIHALATNPDTGVAGGRLACLPVPF
jgi:Cu-Zn family superoxide dismutase